MRDTPTKGNEETSELDYPCETPIFAAIDYQITSARFNSFSEWKADPVMSLIDSLSNIFAKGSPLTAIAYAGTFNVESGHAELRTDYFGACDQCADSIGPVRDCSSCGRQKGNNLNFLAGRGDGAYSGLSLIAGDSLMGAIYVFDEDNAFAMSTAAELSRCDGLGSLRDNQFQQILIDACSDYMNLEGFEAGRIEAGQALPFSTCFMISDLASSRNSEFASVDHPFGNRDYRAILFMEPIDASPAVQFAISLGASQSDFTGGFEDSMRPRVLLLLAEQFIDSILGEMETPHWFDWPTQGKAWNKTLVFSNMVGGGNHTAAMYNNGIFWELASMDQPTDSEINRTIWYLYATRAFGFFVQGALLGDHDCAARMRAQIDLSANAEILDLDVLESSLISRGWDASDKILDEVAGLWQSGGLAKASPDEVPSELPRFCANCGSKFAGAGGKFCSSCGTARS